MAFDLVYEGQRCLRRLGETFRRGRLKGATRSWDYDRGPAQLEQLLSEVEARTGCGVESRRALDFGCGAGRLALPLAQRCEHVYGLDIDPDVLNLAHRNAKQQSITNVTWMEAGRLSELFGTYDFLLSMNVFQHIPSREGERTLAWLIDGLRPGGTAAVQVALRPPLTPSRLFARDYLYDSLHSYSLNRLGRLFTAAKIRPWYAKCRYSGSPSDGHHREDAMIIFQKT